MRTKVIARLFGGLGNQLFIYAAARRLALVNKAELVLDDVSGFKRDTAYRRHYQLDHFHIPCRKATPAERLEPFSRPRRWIKRALNRKWGFKDRSYVVQEQLDFDSRLLAVRPRGVLYLEGYWQGEGYFKDVEATIRSDLRIPPPTDERNRAMAERIGQAVSIAVHVRFFDQPESPGAVNAPVDYYERAVRAMEEYAPGGRYFVFSDNPSAARSRLALADSRVTVVAHNRGDTAAVHDLWLMSQCRHFIIANSTLSWWAAWLALCDNKQVIAPGFRIAGGITSWGFDGLLPADWIRI